MQCELIIRGECLYPPHGSFPVSCVIAAGDTATYNVCWYMVCSLSLRMSPNLSGYHLQANGSVIPSKVRPITLSGWQLLSGMIHHTSFALKWMLCFHAYCVESSMCLWIKYCMFLECGAGWGSTGSHVHNIITYCVQNFWSSSFFRHLVHHIRNGQCMAL